MEKTNTNRYAELFRRFFRQNDSSYTSTLTYIGDKKIIHETIISGRSESGFITSEPSKTSERDTETGRLKIASADLRVRMRYEVTNGNIINLSNIGFFYDDAHPKDFTKVLFTREILRDSRLFDYLHSIGRVINSENGGLLSNFVSNELMLFENSNGSAKREYSISVNPKIILNTSFLIPSSTLCVDEDGNIIANAVGSLFVNDSSRSDRNIKILYKIDGKKKTIEIGKHGLIMNGACIAIGYDKRLIDSGIVDFLRSMAKSRNLAIKSENFFLSEALRTERIIIRPYNSEYQIHI